MNTQPFRSYAASPIISGAAAGFGRIAPGTRLAVRELTDEELGHQVKKLMDLDDKPWERGIHPQRWVVCLADNAVKVLFDWFSPVGSYTEELAVKEALRYCRKRGAVLVDLPTETQHLGN